MGQSESWLWVRDDWRVFEHTENDGYAALRHGLEAVEEEITPEFLEGNPHYREGVKEALIEWWLRRGSRGAASRRP